MSNFCTFLLLSHPTNKLLEAIFEQNDVYKLDYKLSQDMKTWHYPMAAVPNLGYAKNLKGYGVTLEIFRVKRITLRFSIKQLTNVFRGYASFIFFHMWVREQKKVGNRCPMQWYCCGDTPAILPESSSTPFVMFCQTYEQR